MKWVVVHSQLYDIDKRATVRWGCNYTERKVQSKRVSMQVSWMMVCQGLSMIDATDAPAGRSSHAVM